MGLDAPPLLQLPPLVGRDNNAQAGLAPDDIESPDDLLVVVDDAPRRKRGRPPKALQIVDGESYVEARTRRERAAADKEEFQRDVAHIERDQMRGKLVTAKEAKAACAEVRDAFLAVGKQLWTRTDQKLGDTLAASDKQRIALAIQQAWADLLAEVSTV